MGRPKNKKTKWRQANPGGVTSPNRNRGGTPAAGQAGDAAEEDKLAEAAGGGSPPRGASGTGKARPAQSSQKQESMSPSKKGRPATAGQGAHAPSTPSQDDAPNTPNSSSSKKNPKKKAHASGGGRGVDLDDQAVDLAADLLRGATGGAGAGGSGELGEEEGAVGGVGVGAGAKRSEEEDLANKDIVELSFDLCQARLEAAVDMKPGEEEFVNVKGEVEKYRYLGITEASRKLVVQTHLSRRIRQLEAEEQEQLLRRLWAHDCRDSQYLAIDLFTEVAIPMSRNLGFQALFDLMRHFIITKSGCDTVDHLATCHLNALAYLEPPETWPMMEVWVMEDEEPFLQRAALLHQVCLGKYTDCHRLFRFCKRFFALEGDESGFEQICSAMELALDRCAWTAGTPGEGDLSRDRMHDKIVRFLKEHSSLMSPAMAARMMALLEKLEGSKQEELRERMREARSKFRR